MILSETEASSWMIFIFESRLDTDRWVQSDMQRETSSYNGTKCIFISQADLYLVCVTLNSLKWEMNLLSVTQTSFVTSIWIYIFKTMQWIFNRLHWLNVRKVTELRKRSILMILVKKPLRPPAAARPVRTVKTTTILKYMFVCYVTRHRNLKVK